MKSADGARGAEQTKPAGGAESAENLKKSAVADSRETDNLEALENIGVRHDQVPVEIIS